MTWEVISDVVEVIGGVVGLAVFGGKLRLLMFVDILAARPLYGIGTSKCYCFTSWRGGGGGGGGLVCLCVCVCVCVRVLVSVCRSNLTVYVYV